jgi:antitoxin component YwqK of YwqJK toxin-antitoxin module
MLLMMSLAGCSKETGEETRLFAGYVSYYADGGISSFEEHSYEYDKNGVLVKENVYYNGFLSSYSVIEHTDGHIVESVYDNHDKPQSVRELYEDGSLKSELSYGYSDEPETYIEYDESGLMIFKESYKYNYQVEYEYDKSGNLMRETETDHDSSGVKVYKTDYDAAGVAILRTVTYPDGSMVIDRDVDIHTEGSVRMILESGMDGELKYSTTEEYDDDGYLMRSVTYDATDFSVLSSNEYKYDSEGRVIEKTYFFMDTTVTEYEYADEGYVSKESVTFPRMISNEPYGDGSDCYEVKYTNVTYYDADGSITRKETLMDGVITGYSEYIYETVNIRSGTTYDYRDKDRELDPRSTVVY